MSDALLDAIALCISLYNFYTDNLGTLSRNLSISLNFPGVVISIVVLYIRHRSSKGIGTILTYLP
ncbi:hypothetical protein BDR04DRAFT_1235590 [Suillus decipiens]|nr:hypothetical protein BDR04DRAFT_1235590 [Suillus decipiens]